MKKRNVIAFMLCILLFKPALAVPPEFSGGLVDMMYTVDLLETLEYAVGEEIGVVANADVNVAIQTPDNCEFGLEIELFAVIAGPPPTIQLIPVAQATTGTVDPHIAPGDSDTLNLTLGYTTKASDNALFYRAEIWLGGRRTGNFQDIDSTTEDFTKR